MGLQKATRIVTGVAALSVCYGAPAAANCIGQQFSQISASSGYHYVDFPATANREYTTMIGRFWSPGLYDSTGEQECDESHWLNPYYGRFYVHGTFGAMECTSGCPDEEMIVLLQDVSTDGGEAYFAAGRVDETPFESPEFDFARSGLDWLLRTIPPPVVQGTSSGDPFFAYVEFEDPADGFFGLAGVPPAGTITAFHVYRDVSPWGNSRDRSSDDWEFVERVPYFGGITTAEIELRCPWDVSVVRLAAALELDDGQVLTDYVSGYSVAVCDPWTPGAGRTPETGSGALRVSKTETGDLELTWGYSCVSAENQYSVYEGMLGDWESHSPRLCDILEERTATFPQPIFDAYYVVVPHDGGYEGSYGFDSQGNERPRGTSVCRPQIVNLCP